MRKYQGSRKLNDETGKLLFLLIAALAFAFCGSDEPRYADPEAHEKAFFR